MKTVSEMKKLYEEAQRCGEGYNARCKAVYSLYPDFRDMWMKYWGLNRARWEKYFDFGKKDLEYFLCEYQYNYWLEGMRNLYFMDYGMDVDLQKIKFVRLEGEFNVGNGPEQKLDNLEIECACDFFWCIRASDYFENYPYRTDVTAEMLFEFFNDRDKPIDEEEEEQGGEEQALFIRAKEADAIPYERKKDDAIRDAIWKAYKKRKPLTRIGDL